MTERTWWKEAVVYQIYPKSFSDADGDGFGDLPGVIERLDHLERLGVDCVWLNPVYESPQRDNGYDVSDYRAIYPEFGTMDDWDRLLDELHARDIRLVMDMVPNHTSSDHEWFQRSRSEPDGEYGDYYIWRDGDPDEPPNNWESFFGGSAWEYDDEREAWYLHLYDVSQPDLNWRNPDVREAMADTMNWWLEKGIDGFRLDVVSLLSKTDGLPDGDPSNDWTGSEHFVNGPRIFEYLDEIHENVFAGTDAVAIGEMPNLDLEHAQQYTGPDGPLDLVFHFEHVGLDFGERGRWDVGDWDLLDLKETLNRWQDGLDWNSLFFENHDQPRSVSRFGDDDRYRYESATALATILLTLRGTPFVYQGQEIGMTNGTFESLDDISDVDTVRNVRELIAAGAVADYESIRHVVEHRTRDNARTPMQWDDTAHAGFTDGEPWIPVNENYREINVASERERAPSVLSFYEALIDLRREREALVYGNYDIHRPDDEQLFVYTRTLHDDQVVVVLNFSDSDATADLDVLDAEASLLCGNYEDVADESNGPLELGPYEARLYEQSA